MRPNEQARQMLRCVPASTEKPEFETHFYARVRGDMCNDGYIEIMRALCAAGLVEHNGQVGALTVRRTVAGDKAARQ